MLTLFIFMKVYAHFQIQVRRKYRSVCRVHVQVQLKGKAFYRRFYD